MSKLNLQWVKPKSAPQKGAVNLTVSSAPPSSKKKKRANRRRGRGGMQRGSSYGPMTNCYIKSLVDPFDNKGCKLGWGCFQPSTVSTAYGRFTTTANADGTCAFALVPGAKSFLKTNTAGAAVATWSTAAAANQAAISSNFTSGRPISLGIRAYPDIAATSVPGQCLTGALQDVSIADIEAMTPNDFISLPTSHVFRGYEGASATGRPLDPASFTFTSLTVDGTGYAGGNVPSFSIPYIAFTGLPASAVIHVEGVLNFEGTAKTAHLVAPVDMGDEKSGESLVHEWPSFDALWNAVRSQMPTPGQPGEASATIWSNLNTPLVRGVARGALAYAARNSRGRVRPFMNNLSSVASSFLADRN